MAEGGGRFWMVTMVPELSDAAEVLNITEGHFAFDPTLPGTGCSSSTSWQDGHLAAETHEPPEKRETVRHSNAHTHIRNIYQ